MERLWPENKEKNGDYAAFCVAIAAVQGSWNKETKQVLLSNTREQMGLFPEDGSVIEAAILGAVGRMTESLMGEGSMASVLLKKSIMLPVRDRGLIVAGHIFGILGSEAAHDWETASLLNQSISLGVSFETTVQNLKKGFEKFNSGILGLLKKFSDEGVEADDEANGEGIIKHLRDIYGGSREGLVLNKNNFEKVILEDLDKKMGSKSTADLQLILERLNLTTDDVVLKESVESAKEIIKDSLKRKSEGLNSLLETI